MCTENAAGPITGRLIIFLNGGGSVSYAYRCLRKWSENREIFNHTEDFHTHSVIWNSLQSLECVSFHIRFK